MSCQLVPSQCSIMGASGRGVPEPVSTTPTAKHEFADEQSTPSRLFVGPPMTGVGVTVQAAEAAEGASSSAAVANKARRADRSDIPILKLFLSSVQVKRSGQAVLDGIGVVLWTRSGTLAEEHRTRQRPVPFPSQHPLGPERQTPSSTLPDRVTPVQFLPWSPWRRVPVVIPYELVWVAGGVEEPLDLLVIRGQPLLDGALATVPADARAEDMPPASRSEGSPTVQTL
jgi:hypothetical protein